MGEMVTPKLTPATQLNNLQFLAQIAAGQLPAQVLRVTELSPSRPQTPAWHGADLTQSSEVDICKCTIWISLNITQQDCGDSQLFFELQEGHFITTVDVRICWI